jgi:pyrimidine-nucleoside phosphorylase
MRMTELIISKRNGRHLTRDEIEYFVQAYVAGDIPDYQAAALLMAVYFRGMDAEETAALTLAMAHSGEVMDLSAIPGVKVDKHSTGGVGDTTTLVVAPLVAACGVPVAKISGRGLGHTGGTLDKLESIPGFSVRMSMDDFISLVQKNSLAVVGQSERLVPADRKLYALRDVTGTVENLSLIASSIMSKKIAAGADAILLDVKTGDGAFLEKEEEAFALAREMVSIGTMVGREAVALVTDMNEPLGQAVGNALEVKEAIEILRGERTGRLLTVCIALGAEMLTLGGVCASVKEGKEKLEKALRSGQGLSKFAAMIEAQGGDPRVAEDTDLLPQAREQADILTEKDGYIADIRTRSIGEAASILGAGRRVKEDTIDPAVGLWMHVRSGDRVEKGAPLATIYYNDPDRMVEAERMLQESIIIEENVPVKHPLLYGRVTKGGVEWW